MTDVTLIIAIAIFTFVLAGFVKGVIGMGLPTIAVGLLSLMISPAEAVALMLIPSLLTNIWQGLVGPYFMSSVKRLWPTFIGLCVGTWVANLIGVGLLTPEAASRARITLGVTLIVYAALGLSRIQLRLRAGTEMWLGPIVGVATGILSAATGVFMIPAIPYYQAIGFEKDELVQAQGISYTISTLALAVLLLYDGVLRTGNATWSLAAVVPALAGMVAGQYVRGLVQPATFRLCFYVGILAIGAYLALMTR